MTATKLLSDNGVSSGITGYQLTGGNDGTLQLQTTTSGGTATTAVTIDDSQNVGIGTSSPSDKLQIQKAVGGAYTGGVIAGGLQINTGYAAGDGGYGHNGITFYGDADNASFVYQVHNSSTDSQLVFGSNNAERMRINSSGNVGIGTSSPVLKTEVRGSASSPTTSGTTPTGITAVSNNDTYGTLYTGAYPTSPYALWMQGASRNALGTYHDLVLQPAGGNVGVGTSSPATNLHVNNATGGAGQIRVTSSTAGYATNNLTAGSGIGYVGTSSAHPLGFVAGNSEVGRFDTSGNLLVGTTDASNSISGTSGIKFFPAYSTTTSTVSCIGSATTNASSSYILYSSGAGAYRFYVDYGGTIHATATSIAAISDATLKTNVKDLETGLTEVMALKPRRFDWINGDATNVAGFIAQEVEQVLPELVVDSLYSQDEEGNEIYKKNLKMGDILPTLVKAIQEQQALIQQLTARIETLEAK